MKTEISRFCESYLHTVSSLPPALKTAAETMEKATGNPLLQAPLATLNDIRARLRSLVEKLESQQAYLLIFGPLKSGKSTLMNAISGAYVSEVTSLPGYPCLVLCAHAEQAAFFRHALQRARVRLRRTARVLKEVIADSHIALAEQIRLHRGSAAWSSIRAPISRGDPPRRHQAAGAEPRRIRHRARGHSRSLQPDEFRLRRAHPRVPRSAPPARSLW